MHDTDYTSLRREFLGIGVTGAMVGLAGCSDSVTIETRPDDDDTEATNGENDGTSEESGNQNPNLELVELSFSYSEAEQQVTIEFAGGADIQAGNIRVQQGSETQVMWSELGSTTAAPDQNISPGATAVLSEDILNWGQPVAGDDLIRVVYTGRDSPATLERYSPPESTDSELTEPSISAFSIANPSEQQLRVSFDSNEKLSIVQINITGPEPETLTRSDFSETETGSGAYTYVATYQSDSAGEFTATLEVASDEDGNDGSNNNSVSVVIEPEAPSNSLVGYWELNDASGQIIDDAGSNNGEIIDIDSGKVSEAEFGTGTALDFSDTDDYIQIPSTDRLSGGQSARISVTAWIKPSESSQQVVGKQNDKSSGDWGLHVNDEAFAEDRDSSNWNEYHEQGSDNPPYLRYYSETPESGDTELLTDDISWNEWQHIGFTLDQPDNTIRLYINGEMTYEVTNVPHVSANTNAPVQIGVNRYPGSEEPESSYYGLVSDVRVYDRVLSETEINTISQADDRR